MVEAVSGGVARARLSRGRFWGGGATTFWMVLPTARGRVNTARLQRNVARKARTIRRMGIARKWA
jgi:hypothetical protein